MMDDNEIIAFVKNQIYDWALGDVKRASLGGSKIGAFILASLLIDYLACFYSNKESTGKEYKNFCKVYLREYNSDDLYHSLRCKLVHNYTEGGKYAFTDKKEWFHMKKSTSGQIILNLENFIKDIELAMEEYFIEINKNEKLKINLLERYKKIGILGRVNVDIVR